MTKTWILLPLCVLAIGGCNSNKGANQSAGNAVAASNDSQPGPSANESAAAAAASTPQPASGDHPEELAGRWSPTGDCSQWFELHQDGRLSNADNNPGTWATKAEGDEVRLTLITNGGGGGSGTVSDVEPDSFTWTVSPEDADAPLMMRRCPAPGG
jgi:hypothetical protein